MNQLAPQHVGLPEGYRLHRYDRVTSTNDEAKRLEQPGAVVWALEQSAGRGRQTRHWASPPGNLYLSILVAPDAPASRAAQLSFVAGLAVRDAVASLRPDLENMLALKWPNDVLLEGRKLAGLLLESHDTLLIVGIGVNALHVPEGLEGRAAALGTSGPAPKLEDLVSRVVAFWDRGLDEWRRDGFAPARARWLDHAAYLGRSITARLADATMTGIFEGLDDEGGLILRASDGTKLRVLAGDIFGD